MKITEGLKVINEGWIKKPKGFRVKYEKLVDSKLTTEYSPGLKENPLDSDVTAWRYAWKLLMATKSDDSNITQDELVNICVVNDSDITIDYYATGQKEVFNKKST